MGRKKIPGPPNENCVRPSYLAKELGISPSAVKQATDRGKIKLCGAGNRYIDKTDPVNVEYMRSIAQKKEQERREKEAEQAAVNRARHQQEEVAARLGVAEDSSPEMRSAMAQVPAEFMGQKTGYEIAKLIASTANTNAQLAKTLKVLVPREFVDGVFGAIGTFIASQLMTAGDRLSAEMATVFGTSDPALINQAKIRIDKDISDVLESMKRMMQEKYEREVEQLK